MSKTPFAKTIRRPAARASRTKASRAAASTTRHIFKLHVAGKAPRVARAINADILDARLHPERVQQPVVVVRISVDFVDGHIDFVGALDEIERFDRERRLAVAGDR